MLSLTTHKSGALIGVLISVTTIPAAANVGIAAAYGDGESFRGSLGQLGINIAALLVAGTLTLAAQRAVYHRRRAAHRRRRRRRDAGQGEPEPVPGDAEAVAARSRRRPGARVG